MNLSVREKEIYKNINLYNRFEKLSSAFQFESDFEFSIEKVLELIEEFGYKVKYIKSDNFFRIKEHVCNYDFNFNICLKYANVELVIGAKNIVTNEVLGKVFGMLLRLIEISENRERDNKIRYPKFRDYIDLREIFKESFSIYEDFKKEVLQKEL